MNKNKIRKLFCFACFFREWNSMQRTRCGGEISSPVDVLGLKSEAPTLSSSLKSGLPVEKISTKRKRNDRRGV